MNCYAYNCLQNENGYCSCPGDISIDVEGECSEYFPTPIILWADGSKTVVMCGKRDTYDPEKGMAMAIARKALGNKGNYYNTFEKWMPKESTITHSVTVFADDHPIEIVNKKED